MTSQNTRPRDHGAEHVLSGSSGIEGLGAAGKFRVAGHRVYRHQRRAHREGISDGAHQSRVGVQRRARTEQSQISNKRHPKVTSVSQWQGSGTARGEWNFEESGDQLEKHEENLNPKNRRERPISLSGSMKSPASQLFDADGPNHPQRSQLARGIMYGEPKRIGCQGRQLALRMAVEADLKGRAAEERAPYVYAPAGNEHNCWTNRAFTFEFCQFDVEDI
ncbi:hypothetical protein FB451DRAFT_1375331 [Mycena latifolia]|nr:hypothetical protein FB451DRAFT_1375331 [Mycena latifolia]